jgi:hypothetical protein
VAFTLAIHVGLTAVIASVSIQTAHQSRSRFAELALVGPNGEAAGGANGAGPQRVNLAGRRRCCVVILLEAGRQLRRRLCRRSKAAIVAPLAYSSRRFSKARTSGALGNCFMKLATVTPSVPARAFRSRSCACVVSPADFGRGINAEHFGKCFLVNPSSVCDLARCAAGGRLAGRALVRRANDFRLPPLRHYARPGADECPTGRSSKQNE